MFSASAVLVCMLKQLRGRYLDQSNHLPVTARTCTTNRSFRDHEAVVIDDLMVSQIYLSSHPLSFSDTPAAVTGQPLKAREDNINDKEVKGEFSI